MVPPEFGPRIGPHSNPVTAGEPAGHCLPAAYGRLPSTAARALHRPAPLFGRGSGVLLPVTACFIGGYSTTFFRLRQGVGGGFFCRCRQGVLLDRRRLAPARWVPARSRAGERRGTAYPLGGRGSSEASGRSAPLPRLPGGGPHFSREMGRKRAGGKPPGPRVHGPLTLVRSFWGSLSLVR